MRGVGGRWARGKCAERIKRGGGGEGWRDGGGSDQRAPALQAKSALALYH